MRIWNADPQPSQTVPTQGFGHVNTSMFGGCINDSDNPTLGAMVPVDEIGNGHPVVVDVLLSVHLLGLHSCDPIL